MYSQQVADEICRRLAEGETLRTICKTDGMPSVGTVCGWAIGIHAPPEFAEQYARARTVGIEVLADEVQHISDTPIEAIIKRESEAGVEITRKDAFEHRRLQVDSRKWLLSKMRPEKYGDRTALEHSGPGGSELKVVVEHIGSKPVEPAE